MLGCRGCGGVTRGLPRPGAAIAPPPSLRRSHPRWPGGPGQGGRLLPFAVGWGASLHPGPVDALAAVGQAGAKMGRVGLWRSHGRRPVVPARVGVEAGGGVRKWVRSVGLSGVWGEGVTRLLFRPLLLGNCASVETKYPHEAAYDAFLCGSGESHGPFKGDSRLARGHPLPPRALRRRPGGSHALEQGTRLHFFFFFFAVLLKVAHLLLWRVHG